MTVKNSCENDLEPIAASSGVTNEETKVLMRSVKAAPTTNAMAMSMTLPVVCVEVEVAVCEEEEVDRNG